MAFLRYSVQSRGLVHHNIVKAFSKTMCLPVEEIARICRRYEVKELSLFGSVARGDFGPRSDADFMVEFLPEAQTTLIEFVGLQQDLEDLIGRKVDLVSKSGLKRRVREGLSGQTQVLYAAA
jgi:uncharacterized protein